jgi:dTDP-4-dehydrorhamnose 3,5-epimerase
VERIPTRLDGPVLIAPAVHGDARGFFVETFRESAFEDAGVRGPWVQDNHSRSAYGVVRGMHFQLDPPAAKLVRCARGAIVDVVVDVRIRSATYGEWEAFELSDSNQRILYVPVGFAHGFAVVSDVADVLYKQSAEWSASSDRGFSPEDPEVGIEWPVPPGERVLSERDRGAPRLAELEAAVGD